MQKFKEILFIGCGKMGSIIANNLIDNGVEPNQIKALDPHAKKIDGVKYFDSLSDFAANYQADLIFIAIKPQDSEEILQKLARSKKFSANTIFISILAGKKIEFFENILGEKAKIIRSMPNLPIDDSQGVFAYYLNQNIKSEDIKKLEEIFNNFGEIIELKEEKLFDAITAIFGSGPAYIFYLQEIFTKISVASGIKEEKARELVKRLFLGSSLMSCNSDKDFSELCESVTSKKGTTDAALQLLQKDSAIENLFKTAIDAAIQRSKELGE